jgi:sialidase-1
LINEKQFKTGRHSRLVSFLAGAISAMFALHSANAAPDPASVYAWFKADAGAMTNSSGTVTNWSNQASSGNVANRNLNRFGGAPRLISAETSSGAKNILRFNGGDNLYGVPTLFGSLPNVRTIVVYLRLNSTNAGFLFDGASNVGMTRAQVREGNWQVGIQPPPIGNGANADPLTLPSVTNAWQLHFFAFEPLTNQTRITHSIWNGASFTYTNAQTNALAGFIVGQNVSQQFGIRADVGELLVYDRAPPISEQEDLANYLKEKWGNPIVAPPPTPERVPVFVNGQDGYACYRIPAMITTANGTVIAMADGRISGCGDIPNPLDLVIRRSFDNGRNWGPLQVVANYGSDTSANDVDTYPYFGITDPVQRVAAGDASLLLDRSNRRVWALYDNGARVEGQAFNRVIKLEMRYTDDDGATWSDAIDVETQNPDLRPSGSQFLTGPGNGIQIENGPHAERLVFPVYIYGGPNYSTIIYSDDHGQTWKLGGNAGTGGGEDQVAETANGNLLMTMRDAGFSGTGKRYFSRSSDGGETWATPFTDTTNPTYILDPVCQGSILRLTTTYESNASRLVHANAAHASSRVNMTLRISYDEGQTWAVSNQVYAGGSAYSALTKLASGEVGLIFEIDNYARIDFVRRSVSQMTRGADSLPAYTVWAGEQFTPTQLSNPAVSDPNADADKDGMSNEAEFSAGTNPNDPNNLLKLEIKKDESGATICFQAVSNKSYSLQSTSNLTLGDWQRKQDFPAASSNAAISAPLHLTNGSEFFRLITPQSP